MPSVASQTGRWTLARGARQVWHRLVRSFPTRQRRDAHRRQPAHPAGTFLCVAVLAVAAAGCGHSSPRSSAAPSDKPTTAVRDVVVDTDMAADDILALAYLLGDKAVRVVGITVVGSGEVHCPVGGQHARALAAAVHHVPIPVACGNVQPLGGSTSFPAPWRTQADGFYGMTEAWPQPSGWPSVGNDPVALIRDVAERAPVTIVALGPLTTVAKVLNDPHIRSRVDSVVISGGAVNEIGNMPSADRTVPVREWNLGVDPIAGDRVLRGGRPTTVVPLDATDRVPLDVRFAEALRATPRNASGDAALRFLDANMSLTRGGFYLWDCLAGAAAVDPHVVTMNKMSLSVQTSGADAGRLTVDSAGPPVTVAVRTDVVRFTTMMLSAFTSPGRSPAAYPTVHAAITVDRDENSRYAATVGTVRHGAVTIALSAAEGAGFGLAVLRLTDGHTLTDISRVIAAGVTQPPTWAPVEVVIDVPAGAAPIWEVSLPAGRHVLVGADRNGTGLAALREVVIT
jgi:inosine-uridine nucleoside N-ribohydrolase